MLSRTSSQMIITVPKKLFTVENKVIIIRIYIYIRIEYKWREELLSPFGSIAQLRFNFGKNGKITFMANEDEIYKRIGDEIENNNLDKVAWTKAQGDSDGSESRAKSLYIKYTFEK